MRCVRAQYTCERQVLLLLKAFLQTPIISQSICILFDTEVVCVSRGHKNNLSYSSMTNEMITDVGKPKNGNKEKCIQWFGNHLMQSVENGWQGPFDVIHLGRDGVNRFSMNIAVLYCLALEFNIDSDTKSCIVCETPQSSESGPCRLCENDERRMYTNPKEKARDLFTINVPHPRRQHPPLMIGFL